MSAIMAVVQRDRVHVLADAAFYMPDGTLDRIAPKVIKIPRINAVFTGRGMGWDLPLFMLACASVDYHDFDSFRDGLPQVFASFDHLVAEVATPEEQMGGEILVAGWSEQTARGEVLFRHTFYDLKGELKPGSIYRLGDLTAFGPFEDAGFECRADVFDPHTDGVALFEAARCTPADLTCGLALPVMGFAVGGFLGLATITAAGVERSIIHRWPDRVGERIEPHQAANLPLDPEPRGEATSDKLSVADSRPSR